MPTSASNHNIVKFHFSLTPSKGMIWPKTGNIYELEFKIKDFNLSATSRSHGKASRLFGKGEGARAIILLGFEALF